MGRVIAIDGPSGAGKSTVAKLLAELLGFKYLDTGALYRAVALGLCKMGIEHDSSDEKIISALRNILVTFVDGNIYLNGRDVSEEIRIPIAGHYSSVFSARKPIRDFLLPLQRAFAQNSDIVAEGRDMTTVVFPDAWKKFYLDASLDERVKRRYLQLQKIGIMTDMDNANEDILERDRRDSSRDIAPLRIAPDAVFIDTSNIEIDEVIKKILEVLKVEY